jgi:hypothetical protein
MKTPPLQKREKEDLYSLRSSFCNLAPLSIQQRFAPAFPHLLYDCMVSENDMHENDRYRDPPPGFLGPLLKMDISLRHKISLNVQ